MTALRVLLLLLIPVTLLTGPVVWAGSIAGVAVDEAGAPIPDVSITLSIQRGDTGRIRQADASGRFVYARINSGVYFLSAQTSGRQSLSVGPIYLHDDVDLNLILELPARAEGEGAQRLVRRPTLAGAEPSAGAVLSKEFLDRVPAGRGYSAAIPAGPRPAFGWLQDTTIDVQRVVTGEVLSRHEQARLAVAPTIADRAQVVAGVTLDADGRLAIRDAPASETRLTLDHLWIPDAPLYALNPTGPARLVDETEFLHLRRR